MKPNFRPEQNLENRERMKISKLHFLVHPGFLSDPNTLEKPTTWQKLIAEGHDYDSIMAELRKWEETLQIYVEQAKKLKEDELMFVFTHTTSEQLKEDLEEKKAYAVTLKAMKKILDKRLVVVSGDFDIFNEAEALDVAKEVAAARGYVLDEDVFTEAYGEILEQCVTEGAAAMNRKGGFRNKTVVRQKLTDLGLTNMAHQEAVAAKNREMYPQVFDNLEFD